MTSQIEGHRIAPPSDRCRRAGHPLVSDYHNIEFILTMTIPNTKVLVVFGTRPEAIKLFPVVAAMKEEGSFEVCVCVSAQHRGMLDQVLATVGVIPDHDLNIMRSNQSLDGLTASLLTGIGALIDSEAPARVMVKINSML